MKSDFLFATQSFLSGVARLLDLGAQFDSYNQSETGDEADARAFYGDFAMVGQDLQKAMEIFVVEAKTQDASAQLPLAFNPAMIHTAPSGPQKEK